LWTSHKLSFEELPTKDNPKSYAGWYVKVEYPDDPGANFEGFVEGVNKELLGAPGIYLYGDYYQKGESVIWHSFNLLYPGLVIIPEKYVGIESKLSFVDVTRGDANFFIKNVASNQIWKITHDKYRPSFWYIYSVGNRDLGENVNFHYVSGVNLKDMKEVMQGNTIGWGLVIKKDSGRKVNMQFELLGNLNDLKTSSLDLQWGSPMEKTAQGTEKEIFICFWLPRSVEGKFDHLHSIEDDLHMTLVYVPDAEPTEEQKKKLLKEISKIAKGYNYVKCKFTGFGTMKSNGSKEPTDVVLIDSVDGSKIHDELVKVVEEAYKPWEREYGYLPHVSLRYKGKGKVDLKDFRPFSWKAKHISVKFSDKEAYAVEMKTGEITKTISKLAFGE